MSENQNTEQEAQQLDAKAFARFLVTSTNDNEEIQFGTLGQVALVVKLRDLANRIEANTSPRIVLLSAHSCDEAKHGDFLLTTLVLQFGSLSPTAKKGTALYGGDQFPVEVARGPHA